MLFNVVIEVIRICIVSGLLSVIYFISDVMIGMFSCIVVVVVDLIRGSVLY